MLILARGLFIALNMETTRFYEMSALTIPTRRHIPEDDILHSHCREHLKLYIALTGWTL
jgi:hypothetical protein